VEGFFPLNFGKLGLFGSKDQQEIIVPSKEASDGYGSIESSLERFGDGFTFK